MARRFIQVLGLFALSCMVAGCDSGTSISNVRFGSLEAWGPVPIEDQLKYWDCASVDWTVENEYPDFTAVTAKCHSVTRTAFNAKLRTSVCLNSIEYKHHCLDLFDVEEVIQLRFALHSSGRVVLLDGNEQRIKDGKVLHDAYFPLSFLEHIRDAGAGRSELAYSVLESLEKEPQKVDMIWSDLIMNFPQAQNVRYKPEHFEVANFIKKRLKEAYSPEDMAYGDTSHFSGLVATQ
ncbi:MAG: hypothetical protein O9274_03135 [Limnobacter sp.]|uniref:hypothetical protein n=1 Tax=Limnobacter sp. TaxID=2003368 RepID=UPI0022C40E17|nr:hypothetical protein [Limnobacter sp.]MCZ8014673.1 hypothetical protein [Limnobacter sp.]